MNRFCNARTARQVWLEYHIVTELQDRALPGVERAGEWQPHDRAMMQRFARCMYDQALARIQSLGIPPEVSGPAKRDVAHLGLRRALLELAEEMS